MGEWRTERLGDLLQKVVDNRGKTPPTQEFGQPLLEVNAVSSTLRSPNYTTVRKFVSEETFKTWFRSGHPDVGDVLVPTVGTIGNVAMMSARNGAIAQNLVALRCSPENSGEFLYYFLSSPLGRDLMLSLDIGGVQPSIKVPHLLDLPVTLPPLAEQKAIAAVLSSLDDKIDLLHRQNKTLEAMAETLFRQWFVEEAQDDWEEMPLDVVADFLNGLACQKYPPQNEVDKLPVLKIKELKGGVTENSDWATSDVKEEYIVRSGDIIFSWSGSLVVKLWDGSECVLNQHLFKVTSQRYSKWFIYLWTRYHLQEFIAIAESKATTMGHIKRRDLSNSMVLVPDDDELDTMNGFMEPLIDKLILNNAQLHKLENLRDTLLPNLMSGEVRVAQ